MVLPLLGLFNPKLKLFVAGRKRVFDLLTENISAQDKVIWIHAASLGEFEQGLPILEKLKETYTSHKFLLTFFSPSGYEVKKNSGIADVITYLPLDTPINAKKFVKACHPELAIFIKYEIWPYLLKELKLQSVPTLLVSALFKKNQVYFKWYGQFMRNSLNSFTKIFVQNEASKSLLESIDHTDAEISGDTRFDRVSQLLNRDNQLQFMNDFKDEQTCFVAGSTWPEDEAVLVDFINSSSDIKTVIAPHDIKPKHISELKSKLQKSTILFSEMEQQRVEDFEVLIVDTIGLLTKIYSYADFAYVGGGFKTGLHNTLEPAVFGIPVIIGPNYSGFAEAEELVKIGGVLSVRNKQQFEAVMRTLLNSAKKSEEHGKINSNYIEKSKGATTIILNYTKSIL